MPQSDDPLETLADHPGVKLGAAGCVGFVLAILWTVLVPSPDAPFGVGEVLALVSGLMFLGGAARAGMAFLGSETGE